MLSRETRMIGSKVEAGNSRNIIDNEMVRGWMAYEEVHSGLIMSSYDLTTIGEGQITQPVERSLVLGMVLEGDDGGFDAAGYGLATSRMGQAHILGFGETRDCTRTMRPGDRCKRAGVIVKPDFLERHAESIARPDRAVMEQFLAPGFHSRSLPMSEMVTGLAEALMQSPYMGSLGKLYRESATLQFLLRSLGHFGKRIQLIGKLGSRKYDAIMHAQFVIESDIANPPSTIALARHVGLNVNHLQAGFRTIFSCTVFGYVRRRRLELAQGMILEGRGSAEAGYAVGFSSPSAFSKAFREHFGHSPTKT